MSCRQATETEKRQHGETRQSAVYFVDVTFTPPKAVKGATSAAKKTAKIDKAAKEEAAAKAVPGRATYTERGDADPGGSSPPAKPKRRAPPTTKPAAPVFDAEPGAKQTGVVKFYDSRVRFFGFITADADGSDIYVRRNNIKKGHKLYPGTAVEFEVENTSKTPQAKKVKVVS